MPSKSLPDRVARKSQSIAAHEEAVMRIGIVTLVGILLAGAARGADAPATRHGIMIDLQSFPQATPKEALASALKAINLKRFDYLLAHLSDPAWVDERSAAYADGFKEMVREAGETLDPPAVKHLRRFLEEGEFETLETTAVVRHKDVKDRVVRLRRIDKRWFFLNTRRP
jgi:hypothetical protein